MHPIRIAPLRLAIACAAGLVLGLLGQAPAPRPRR